MNEAKPKDDFLFYLFWHKLKYSIVEKPQNTTDPTKTTQPDWKSSLKKKEKKEPEDVNM